VACVKLLDRALIHGAIIGVVAAVGLAVVGLANCQQRHQGFQQEEREGAAWAGAHPWPSCVEEAIRRGGHGPLSALQLAQRKAFLKTCLGRTTEPPGTCAALPLRSDPSASSAWARGFCADAGATSSWNCELVVRGIQEECERTSPAP
jgi:hypothetical protein